MIATVLFQRGNVPLRGTLLTEPWKERIKKEDEHNASLQGCTNVILKKNVAHNFVDT